MIVIVGASASGKTGLAKDFVKQHPEYKRIVTYTTRPKRDGEVDGVDYHFISYDKFAELANSGFFAEYNAYREWYYGTALEDCTDDIHSVAVLTPAGLRNIVHRSIKVLSIYLYVDRVHRLLNSLMRGDNVDEAYRRNLSDVGQFDGVENEVMAVINNAELKMSKEDVLAVMNEVLKAYEAGELNGESH